MFGYTGSLFWSLATLVLHSEGMLTLVLHRVGRGVGYTGSSFKGLATLILHGVGGVP